jgi:hypothetical protein
VPEGLAVLVRDRVLGKSLVLEIQVPVRKRDLVQDAREGHHHQAYQVLRVARVVTTSLLSLAYYWTLMQASILNCI